VAAAAGAAPGDRLGDLATVEQVLAFDGEDLEGLGQLRQEVCLALADEPARVERAGEQGAG
jgi:hypothetical protein